jgi:signal transduction histidine kinase
VEILHLTNQDPEQKIFLDIILRNSMRINDLVTDLLASYRTDEMQPEKHSIHLLLDEVLAQAADRVTLKTVSVTKDYTCPDDKILMNRQKIKIALTNIVINALDAMPPENGQLKVRIKSIDDNCIVEIEDNGIGISKENIAHIFEPYFTGKANGMGLGLSTTLNILQSNHASVKVESEEGTGTRFILSFGGVQPPNKTTRLTAYGKPFAVKA